MPGYFPQAVQETLTLVTAQGPLFHGFGMQMIRTFAVCRIVYEGFEISFRNKPSGSFANTLLLIAIVNTGMTYYNAPFPGVGKDLTHIVTDVGQDLAAMIDTKVQEDVGTAMADAVGKNAGTSWYSLPNAMNMVRFFIIQSVLSLVQAAILGVISVAFIFVGILVIVGPLFLPWLVVPGYEHWARNWFESLVQYAFYPVVANAYVMVVGHIWLNFLSGLTTPMDSETMAAKLTVVMTMAFATVYGLLKIPQMVSHLFSGSSGIGGWR